MAPRTGNGHYWANLTHSNGYAQGLGHGGAREFASSACTRTGIVRDSR